MRLIKILQIFIIALMSFATFDSSAAKPSQKKATSSTRKSASTQEQVAVSFSLFQKLSSKSTDEVLEYLKQHGCKIEYSSEVFSTKVRGGFITIYPPRISYPRMGVGPVEFFTEDTKVCQAWRTGLEKAGYGEFGGKDIWVKERMVYGCPTFGIADFIDCDVEDDYSGVATLYVKHFYED